MRVLPTLTLVQYEIITNVMSFAVASMFAGALFFFFSRSQVAPKYRPAMLITALVPAIAFYHYLRIYASFTAAYGLKDSGYLASGVPFNDAYRYADWLLTVPLLVIELVAVLALSKSVTRSLSIKLGGAAALMILLGYPGEIAVDSASKWLWWSLSMVPFLYIMTVLFTSFSKYYADQPESIRNLIGGAKWVILITWSFYPLAYALNTIGLPPGVGQTALQVGYTVADITAKVGMGIYIYFIAVAKSEADGWSEDAKSLVAQPA